MNRLVCMTAGIALTATTALGQTGSAMQAFGTQGAAVYFQPGNAAGAETTAVVDHLRRALQKSRNIQLLHMADPDVRFIELKAPTALTKDAEGRVTVSFELTPSAGASSPRTYTATCKVAQLERCADAVVTRVERFGRF